MPLTKDELIEAARLCQVAGQKWKQVGRILQRANSLIDELDGEGEPLTAGQITALKAKMVGLRTDAETAITELDALIAS